MLGVDAYPLAALTGNDLAEVADRTRAAYQAAHGSRPVWTVIQFFQLDLESAWPTEQQLHDMSWMAIVEGATGLFYWEYGIRGLASSERSGRARGALPGTDRRDHRDQIARAGAAEPRRAGDHRELRGGHRVHQDQGRRRRQPLPVRVQLYRVARHRRVHARAAGRPASSITTPERRARPIPARPSPACSSRTRRTSFRSAIPLRCGRRCQARRRRSRQPRPPRRPSPPLQLRPPRRLRLRLRRPPPPRRRLATATPTISATPTATATPGALSVSPAKLKFGAQKVGTTSRAKNFESDQQGGAAVSFTGIPTSRRLCANQ